jgi:uncharacterized protein with ATP-grasp and redox domains
MKIYTRCIPCFARQAVEAAEMATEDPEKREEIIRAALRIIAGVSFSDTPPHMGLEIHGVIRSVVGEIDPYHAIKRLYNGKALAEYGFMKNLLDGRTGGGDRFERALRLAVAGNIIDFGVRSKDDVIHIREIIEASVSRPLDHDDGPWLFEELSKAGSILYVTDNAGEILFDRIFIEEIPRHRERVTVLVRGGPVLNDATESDAEEVGLTGIVPVVSSGSDAPGTIYERCSPRVRRMIDESDLVIAKGQGNYETLSERDRLTFFLLRAKCPVIAEDLGVEVGATIVRGKTPLS